MDFNISSQNPSLIYRQYIEFTKFLSQKEEEVASHFLRQGNMKQAEDEINFFFYCFVSLLGNVKERRRGMTLVLSRKKDCAAATPYSLYLQKSHSEAPCLFILFFS